MSMGSHPLTKTLYLLRLPSYSVELQMVFKVVKVVELGATVHRRTDVHFVSPGWLVFLLQLQLTFLGLHEL